MTPALKPSNPEPPPWLKLGYPEMHADYQIRMYNPAKPDEMLFESNPGPQTWGLVCPFEELVVGGKRGGGKSLFLIADFAMGDPFLSADDPARSSFLNDPSFRGLLLRDEYQSMAEFVEQAIAFYKPFGAKATGGASKPVTLDFKTGARIYFNHLGDEEAFNKYKGWNLTKIGIEELTQIPTLRRYLKLLGSLRSVDRIRGKKRFPPLRTQIVSTTNPDGAGSVWVRERFVEIRGANGKLAPWNTPMLDKITGARRIFIPFGIESNPYLSEDTTAGKRYRSMLLSQDEVTRKQWMEGDWNAGTGKFFKEYRPEGPIGQEEHDKWPWACHVIPSAKLEPWWTRWGSVDWGYSHPSAAHKACRNERDKRVHVYDEMTVRHVGSFELGALLAKWWHPELLNLHKYGKDPCITIHVGSDAFSKTDVSKTKAEQMEAGIKEVLGPFGAILLKYNETEREVMYRDPKRAELMFANRRQGTIGKICIALKPVYVDRIAAWAYMRDMLRFRPAVMNLQSDAEREEYLTNVLAQEGMVAYEQQAAELRNIKPEILPKLQIWATCKELDRCMRAAQHDTRADSDPSRPSRREDILKANADENGENGDDALECLVAGTLVETADGQRPIESIRKGEMVWTRAGLRRVLACGKIKTDAEILEVEFSNGVTLSGTHNHQVFVSGSGFVFLQDLRNGDKIEAWPLVRQSSSTASSFTDTQSLNIGRFGRTSCQGDLTASAASALSTKKYGERLTASYRSATKSTISTKTALTTTSVIWSASPALSTGLSTSPMNPASACASLALSVDRWPRSGTPAQRAEKWQRKTTPRLLVQLASLLRRARPVAHLTSLGLTRDQNSAHLSAERGTAESTVNAAVPRNAPCAVPSSYPKTRDSNSAHPIVVTGAARAVGRADVYDLSVEGQPEYFANGILVHNSCRNILLAYKEIESSIPKAEWVADRITEIQSGHVAAFGSELTDPTRLAMIASHQQGQFDRQNRPQGGTLTFSRSATRHRVH